jgi:tRNA-binding EMAP/Myf-like protein
MFPIKPLISPEDLQKVDIRVGTIISVEDLPSSNKLVKLTVEFWRSQANHTCRDEKGTGESKRARK